MFENTIAMRLNDVRPKTESPDGETRKIVELELFLQPFTAQMAADLDIKSHLYARSDGGPYDDVLRVELGISVPLQRMKIASAPDVEPRFVIENVQVGKSIKIRRDKEGPVLAATLAVNFPYPVPEQLLFLFNAYTDQIWVTFEAQQRTLVDSEQKDATEPPATAARRTRKRNGAEQEKPEEQPALA